MAICPRCRITHPPEWYKDHYTEWFFAFKRAGHPTPKAAEWALEKVQKHSSGAPTPLPAWLKVGLFFGGKDMKNQVEKGWKAVDGYKLATGLVLTFLVAIGPDVYDLAVGFGVTQERLALITGAIAVVGALHKVWKKFFGSTDAGK
jgi:hypothetical protein